MSPRHRFPELDWLRFVAACAVMLFHYTFRGHSSGQLTGVEFPLLGQLFKYGFMGVNLFFILSGFVILLTAYERDALAFVISRMVRLYPAYWLCVSLSAGIMLLAGLGSLSLSQYGANLTMLHTYVGIRSVDGVYWSLAVELKFYFLIFLVLAAHQIRHIPALLGLWLGVSLVLCTGQGGAARFFLFPEYSSYFIAGAMFYLVYREGLSAYKLAIILGSFCLSVYSATADLAEAESAFKAHFSSGVVLGLVSLAYGLFFWIALRPRRAGGADRFRALGLLTYPLYLLHQNIGFVLMGLLAPWLNRYLLLAAAVGAMIALAYGVQAWPEPWLARRLKLALLKLEDLSTFRTRAGLKWLLHSKRS